jgi:hypothetical protein
MDRHFWHKLLERSLKKLGRLTRTFLDFKVYPTIKNDELNRGPVEKVRTETQRVVQFSTLVAGRSNSSLDFCYSKKRKRPSLRGSFLPLLWGHKGRACNSERERPELAGRGGRQTSLPLDRQLFRPAFNSPENIKFWFEDFSVSSFVSGPVGRARKDRAWSLRLSTTTFREG